MARLTLPFNGSVPAGGELTLCSKLLTFPYFISQIIASFALGTNRTLQLRFFKSNDPTCPATGKPTGLSLLSIYGEDPYLTGDDDQKSFPHEIEVRESGSYIKVHANNTDAFAHTLDAQVVIDSGEGKAS